MPSPRTPSPKKAEEGALPNHPLTEALAERLLPYVCEHSAIDRVEHARGVARQLLAAYEHHYRDWLEGRP